MSLQNMYLVLFCALHFVQAVEVNSKLGNLPILQYNAAEKAIGKIYTLNAESFRLYLGVADECTQILMCNNVFAPKNGDEAHNKSTTADASTGTSSTEATPTPPLKQLTFESEMCQNGKIVFNLLDNSVTMDDNHMGYLVSPVADFMFDGTTYKLKLFETINTSDLKEPDLKEVQFSLGEWKKVTLLSSGFDCDASIETFIRQGFSNTQQIGDGVSWLRLPTTARKYAIPFANAAKAKTELVTKCQDTIHKPDMVPGWGQYIKNTEATPQKFTIGLKTSGNGVSSIQLEVKDPADCEYIRVCFGDKCEVTKEVDLIFYHRYYVPMDSDRAIPFHVPVTELDTFVFDFTKEALVMRYGAVASTNGIKWVTHPMTPLTTTEGVPEKMTLIAGKCSFRVSRPLANNLVSTNTGATRSNLHPTSCTSE